MSALDVAEQMRLGAPIITADINGRDAKQKATQADLDATDLELAKSTADLLRTLNELATCQGHTPPPPVEPPPPSTGQGTLDARLQPTNGKIVFGASTPSGDGTYNYTKGWTEFVATTDVPPDATHFYRVGDVEVVTPAMKAASPGAILVVNHKLAGGMGKAAYQKTLAGGADAAIRRAANGIMAYDKAMHYLPNHEPENDNIDPVDPAVDILYRDACKYVIDMLDRLGVKRVADGGKVSIGFNPMSFAKHIPRYDTLFAGRDYYDMIWGDPYAHVKTETMANFGSIVQFYAWAKKWGLNMGWAEYGVDMTNAASFAVFGSAAAVEAMVKAFPLLTYLLYWNQKMAGATNNYRLDAAPPAAVKAWAKHDRFNLVVPTAMMAAPA